MKLSVFLVAICAVCCSVNAKNLLKVGDDGCSSPPNAFATFTDAPTLIKTVPNGKLWIAGNQSSGDGFYIAKVFGTPTQQGTAYGLLFKDIADAQYQNLLNYIEGMIEKAIPSLPAWLVDLVVQYGAPYLLDLTWNMTEAFIPQRYKDEMDAASAVFGWPVNRLRGISVFPEAIKMSCSATIAMGSATPGGTIHHLRTLDFGQADIKDFPLVTVYQDADPTIPQYAKFDWVCFFGALSSVNDNGQAQGEKVWGEGTSIFNGSLTGEPATFMYRDLMRVKTQKEAMQLLFSTQKTCSVHTALSFSNEKIGQIIRMDYKDVDVYDWTNWTNGTDCPSHPTLKDVVYVDKYWQGDCGFFGSGNMCYANTLQAALPGNLTAEYLHKVVAAKEDSGDINLVSFDLANNLAWFSNGRKTNVTTGALNANQRQPTKIDLKALWAAQNSP